MTTQHEGKFCEREDDCPRGCTCPECSRFDAGYRQGVIDGQMIERRQVLDRLRANANATGLPACHDCVIDIANWLDPKEVQSA